MTEINKWITSVRVSLNELEKEVNGLREDIVSILGAIDMPHYANFPLIQEELRNMMIKYGQEHLTGRDEYNE